MTTHSYTSAVQTRIVAAMNILGETLVGSSWEPILESPVPDAEIDAILQGVDEDMARRLYENEPPKPQQPWENLSDSTREYYRQYVRNLQADKATPEFDIVDVCADGKVIRQRLESCQHHRIRNRDSRCTVCDERMVAYTVEPRTVVSSPNMNPCTDPEHLRKAAAGEQFECNVPYVAGPARTVTVGQDTVYQCKRCASSLQLIEGEEFVPDCGRSHIGVDA
jgi:hypothetical protein